MSDGKKYLNFVIEKLKMRLDEVQHSIQEGQKEIEGMHEYYWENYTEMDQYGYENFDISRLCFIKLMQIKNS